MGEGVARNQRKAGPSQKGKGNRTWETKYLAPYKKTPKGSRLTWSLGTKVGFCSSRTSSAPGHLKEEPPTFTLGIDRTKYLPSRLLPFLRNEDTCPSISDFTVRTSRGWRWSSSSSISLTIGVDTSLFWGIEEPSLSEETSNPFFLNIREFIQNFSQAYAPELKSRRIYREPSGFRFIQHGT